MYLENVKFETAIKEILSFTHLNQSTTISSEEIVSRLLKGDPEACSALYDQYAGSLYGVILKIVRSEDDAQDVLQDAFVKIWKNIKKFDRSKGTLFTWMLNIARNTAIDKYRKLKKEGKVEIQIVESGVGMSAEHSNEQSTDKIGLKEEVKKLNPEHQLMIDYIYFQGYTQQEVADELEMPLGTVKTRVRSAVIELRKTFLNFILFWI
ncbi:MAG: RNA polymerase sigma factor [Crocinitomicaceae bacterium]